MGRVRCRACCSARGGLSLIEILIAALILAVGLVGVAGSLSYGAKVSRLAQDTMVAESLAAGLLAEARTQELDELESWYTYPGEIGAAGLELEFSRRLGESRLALPQVWFTVTDVQTDLKGVSVVIRWGTSYPSGKVETETLVSPRF